MPLYHWRGPMASGFAGGWAAPAVERLPRVFYRTKPMEFSGLVSFVYMKSVHVDQEFGEFCGAPYVAEGIIQLSRSGRWPGRTPIGRVQSAFLPEMRIARRRQGFGDRLRFYVCFQWSGSIGSSVIVAL